MVALLFRGLTSASSAGEAAADDGARLDQITHCAKGVLAVLKPLPARRCRSSSTSPSRLTGMRDRLPSGSTTNNNGTPRRLQAADDGKAASFKVGCRLRMMTTEVGRSWEWVVCGVFVRGYSPCRAFEVGITPDRRSARAASDQDVAGLPRGRTDDRGTKDTHDRGARQAWRGILQGSPSRRGWPIFTCGGSCWDGRCSGSSEPSAGAARDSMPTIS